MTQFGESNDALLRMMFKEADEDGSGEIELDEFVHILKKVRRARGKTGLWLDRCITARCSFLSDGLRRRGYEHGFI